MSQNDGRINVTIDTAKVEAGLSKLEARLLMLASTVRTGFSSLAVIEQRIQTLTNTSISGTVTLNNSLNRLNTTLDAMHGQLHNLLNMSMQSFNNTTNGVNQTNTATGGFLKSLKSVGPQIAIISAVAVAAFKLIAAPMLLLVDIAGRLYDKFVSTTVAYQGFMASINTQFGAGTGPQMWAWMVDTSNALGISIQDNVKSFHQLAASMAGLDSTGEVTKDIFSGVAVAGAVLQRSGSSVSRAMEAMQQIITKQKPSWEELRQQLGDHVPGAIKALVTSLSQSERYIKLGASSASTAYIQLGKDIKAGTLSSIEVVMRLANEFKKTYGPAIRTPSQMLMANINLLKNSWTELFTKVSDSKIATSIGDVFNTVSAILQNVGNNVNQLANPIAQAAEWVNNFLKSLTVEDVKYFVDTISTYLKSLGIIFTRVFGGASESVDGAQSTMAGYLKFTVFAIAKVLDSFMSFKNNLGLIMNSLGLLVNSTISAITALIAPILLTLNAIIQKMPGVGEETKKSFLSTTDAFMDLNASVTAAGMANLTGLYDNITFIPGQITAEVTAQWKLLTKNLSKTKIVPKDYSDHLGDITKPKTEAELMAKLKELGADTTYNADEKDKATRVKRLQSAYDKLKAAYDNALKSVAKWNGETGKVESAEEKLARATRELTLATTTLDPATKKAALSMEERDRILKELAIRYDDQLNPINAIIRSYEREATAIGLSGKALKEYMAVEAARESLRKTNPNKIFSTVDGEKVVAAFRDTENRKLDATTLESYGGSKQEADLDKIASVGRNKKSGYLNEGQAGQFAMDEFGDLPSMNASDEAYAARALAYENMQAKITAARDAGVLSEQTASELMADTHKQYAQQSASVTLDRFKNEFQIAQQFGQLGQMLMQTNNKKAFRAGKAMAMASAAIMGAQAVLQALATMPPPFSYVAAGISGAMAAIQIGMIQQQQPPEFATGGSFMVGGNGGTDSQLVTLKASPGERVTVQTPKQVRHGSVAATTEGSARGNTSTMRIELSPDLIIDFVDSDEFDDVLVRRLAKNRTRVNAAIGK